MTLAESFGLGKPAIAVNIGNHADIVRDSGGGVLYEQENIESFCSAVEALLNENQKYARNALAFYQAHLTKEKKGK